MKLKIQKRLGGQILKCSKNKIVLDPERLEDIKEAITKADIKTLIIDNAISKKPVKGSSRVRARKRALQKRKGKRRGVGTRKGKKTARLPKKEAWMNKIRAQRGLIKELKERSKIDAATYRELYSKAKGGFFRSLRHLKLYIKEHNMMK
ncbi:50S ribosomal protein L19e [Candidatus Woesearchaeota archaeon]|nr:50S ribosomal protein L19e [Candidatus Woesearchaeota archaeon]MBW3021512.1 50S ribosomal protein L19e [Candidatus Woesearchaeota archaeon]